MEHRLDWYPPESSVQISKGTRDIPCRYIGQKVDLHDSIMQSNLGEGAYTIKWKTNNKKWKIWNEENISKIESLIRYDFEFENYTITTTRISGMGEPCHKEMTWSISFSAAEYIDEDML